MPTTARQKFELVMREFESGTLKSGSGDKVTDRKQAQAIAFSEARKISSSFGRRTAMSGKR